MCLSQPIMGRAQNTRKKWTISVVLVALLFLPGSISTDFDAMEEPPLWPEGSNAYDNMVSLTEFGYRKVNSQDNQNARDWIASELEGMGYTVERQPFSSVECTSCENIVVTINGTLDKEWMVVGAHHDAICYPPNPAPGIIYPGCESPGAYDDGTGSGSLLELARTFAEWNRTPLHTWKLGWWDYEEWQGQGSGEGGGMGSLHFVTEQIPEDVNVTYINLDMFGLNWPIQTLDASKAAGCNEDYWTLYMFTSPVEDWSYYEDRGLEVTEQMRTDAEQFQTTLKQINSEHEHPEEWVRVLDDTQGNSDHYNFIINGHTATWLRGQHQYIIQEGDACEQTPKHAQSDSVATINTLAGGRANVEAGLQTGLDVVASFAWLDFNQSVVDEDELQSQSEQGNLVLTLSLVATAIALSAGFVIMSRFTREDDSP